MCNSIINLSYNLSNPYFTISGHVWFVEKKELQICLALLLVASQKKGKHGERTIHL